MKEDSFCVAQNQILNEFFPTEFLCIRGYLFCWAVNAAKTFAARIVFNTFKRFIRKGSDDRVPSKNSATRVLALH